MNLSETDRLVELAAAGGPTSLERLLYMHFDRFLAHIRSCMPRHLSRTEDADDVLQLWEELWADESTASRKLSREEAFQALHISLARLPVAYRQAVELHYFQDKSVADMAQVMQRSPGAIRGLLDRGRQRLRESLERTADWLESR
jgi:RNA polymerase sigma-70 factor (ECF subfamily)